jgi:drug/metabolite transporter (DMT)-like permease
MPATFVFLWSSGFIGAKYGLPYAEPFTFLGYRFIAVIILMLAICLLTRAPWPPNRRMFFHIGVAGLLVHATYLGGVFSSVYYGLPVGILALITGLQPALTAMFARPLLREEVLPRQWVGIALGFIGVFLVLFNKLSVSEGSLTGICFAGVALIGITAGTIYQKKFGGAMDLRTGAVIQFSASAVVIWICAWFFESMHVQWTGEFIFALSWLVLVLSIGAISLLMVLIRRGAASKVASLFYLVPPVTALMSFFIFGETLGWIELSGMAAAVVGVALVTRG